MSTDITIVRPAFVSLCPLRNVRLVIVHEKCTKLHTKNEYDTHGDFF